MAYLYQDPNDPNNPLNQQAAPGGGGAAATSLAPTGAGGPLLGPGAPSSASQTGPGESVPSSSGWTNLRAYLDANKDQAPGLAGMIAQNITTQGDTARNAVGDLSGTYSSRVSASSPGNIDDLLSRSFSSPETVAGNPDDVSKVQNLASGNYNDPGQFESQPGYGDAAAKADAANQMLGLATTEGGQKELLTQLNLSETAGGASLDQMLLSGTPEANTKLSAAAKPYATLRSDLDTAAGTGNAARMKAISDTAAAKGKVQSQLSEPLAGYEGALNKYGEAIGGLPTSQSYDTTRAQWDSILDSMRNRNETDPSLVSQFPVDATTARMQALQKILGRSGQYPVTMF